MTAVRRKWPSSNGRKRSVAFSNGKLKLYSEYASSSLKFYTAVTTNDVSSSFAGRCSGAFFFDMFPMNTLILLPTSSARQVEFEITFLAKFATLLVLFRTGRLNSGKVRVVVEKARRNFVLLLLSAKFFEVSPMQFRMQSSEVPLAKSPINE